MDTLPGPERSCPRCHAAVSQDATQCPHCRLSLEPGVAFFESESAPEPDGPPAAIEPGHEQKVVSCLPTDVERLARSEAVDGWALWETTVDESKPGYVKASFGRPMRRAPRTEVVTPARASDAAGTVPRASTGSVPKSKARRSGKGAPRPELGPEPHTDAADFWRMIPVLVAVGLIVVLADSFGLAGLILGLIFVPGLVRSLLGGGRKR